MDDRYKIVEQFKIKRLVKKLSEAKSSGTSMITVIIQPGKQISDYTRKLTSEYSQAENIKDRANRQSVQDAMTWAKQKLQSMGNKAGDNGLVLYSGKVQTHDSKGEEKILICFEPYKPINNGYYRCDNFFYVEELKSLLEDETPFGFIVIDGHGSIYANVSGNNKTILTKFQVDLPKKHNKGGQSSVRFARIRMEKRQNYLTKVSEFATQCFITDNKVNVQGLILAGSGDFKTELKNYNGLDPRLQEKIISICDVSYGGENGLNEAVERSQEILSNVKFLQEKQLISKFYDDIAQDKGMIIFGANETIKTLESGGLESLILYENLDFLRVSLKNKETDSEVWQIVKPDDFTKVKQWKDGDVECELIKSEPLVDWIAENYMNFGTELNFISDKSPEGFQFVKGFQGIGGFLRYKMDTDFITNANIEDYREDEDDDDFI